MQKKIYPLLLIALCAGILSVAAVPAHAEFHEKGAAMIVKKGPNALIFDGHGFESFISPYMLVTPLTHVYDETGAEISYIDLKFPCQARILYRKKDSGGVPEAVSVHVEYYLDGQTTGMQWNLPVMEAEDDQ